MDGFDSVTLQAILAKVQSTTDGGWRLTFDVSDSDTAAVMKVSPLRNDTLLQLAIIPIDEDYDG